MNSITQHDISEFVSEFFASKTDYSKFDSPENRSKIIARVLSYGIFPSPTAAKRAVLELVSEGLIERTDGKDETDDAREAEQASEERDRQSALAHCHPPRSLSAARTIASGDSVTWLRVACGASRLHAIRLPRTQIRTTPRYKSMFLERQRSGGEFRQGLRSSGISESRSLNLLSID